MKWLAVMQDEADKCREEYRRELDNMELGDLVREFFTYLDYTEESDSGRTFHPVTVSSCRVLLTEPVGMVLKRMRELATGRNNVEN